MSRTGTHRKTTTGTKSVFINLSDFCELLELEGITEYKPEGCTKLDRVYGDGEDAVHYRIYHIAQHMLDATHIGAITNPEQEITHLWMVNASNQIEEIYWHGDTPINLFNQMCRLLGQYHKIKAGQGINQKYVPVNQRYVL